MSEHPARRPSPSMVVACLALFVALGGAAYAVTLAKNSVTSRHVKNASLKGKDLKPDTLGGVQVDESQLARVPSAASATSAAGAANADNADRLGGAAPSAYTGAASSDYRATICDPGTTNFVPCASTILHLPHSGKVLLVAGGGQNSYTPDVGEGTCGFRIDGVLSTSPSVRPGEAVSDNTSQFAQNGFAMTTVTAPLAAGYHSFALVCNERAGEVEMVDTTISAVLAE